MVEEAGHAYGFRVVAQSGDLGDPSKLPQSHDSILICGTGGWRLRRYCCGHRGPGWFVLDMYGEKTPKIERRNMCPECAILFLKEHVIRCALCGLSISPGEAVALYSRDTKGIHTNIATHVGEQQVIGCLRWDCCPCGAFYAGNWSKNGFIPAFQDNLTTI